MLTGSDTRSMAMAANKAFYRSGQYPGCIEEAYPALRGMADTKLRGSIKPIGSCAGFLTADRAAELGLCPGISVAVPQFDAHAAVPALGISRPGRGMLAMGTSSAMILVTDTLCPAEGATSISYEGTLPGLYSYGFGQPAAGDLLGWYADGLAPDCITKEAERRGVSAHIILSEAGEGMRPGATGLLALAGGTAAVRCWLISI